MTNSVTIVSSFLSDANNRNDRPFNKYAELGLNLLKSTVNKIIFLDEKMYNELKDKEYDTSNTLLIKINKKDIYLYNYLEFINKFQINTTYNTKDTLEFMFTMCSKTEWIEKAIQINHFNSDNFIWIDFGIRHIFKNNTDEEFISKINNLNNRKYENIRIGSIWNLSINYRLDIYKDVAWYFAGGVFGGNAKKLLVFSEKMREKCIEIITKKNTLMWEVNIWYLIYLENKEIFNAYSCDHNNTLIDNY